METVVEHIVSFGSSDGFPCSPGHAAVVGWIAYQVAVFSALHFEVVHTIEQHVVEIEYVFLSLYQIGRNLFHPEVAGGLVLIFIEGNGAVITCRLGGDGVSAVEVVVGEACELPSPKAEGYREAGCLVKGFCRDVFIPARVFGWGGVFYVLCAIHQLIDGVAGGINTITYCLSGTDGHVVEVQLIPPITVHGRPCGFDVIGHVGLLERKISSDIIARVGGITVVVDFGEYIAVSHRHLHIGCVAVATLQMPASAFGTHFELCCFRDVGSVTKACPYATDIASLVVLQ